MHCQGFFSQSLAVPFGPAWSRPCSRTVAKGKGSCWSRQIGVILEGGQGISLERGSVYVHTVSAVSMASKVFVVSTVSSVSMVSTVSMVWLVSMVWNFSCGCYGFAGF